MFYFFKKIGLDVLQKEGFGYFHRSHLFFQEHKNVNEIFPVKLFSRVSGKGKVKSIRFLFWKVTVSIYSTLYNVLERKLRANYPLFRSLRSQRQLSMSMIILRLFLKIILRFKKVYYRYKENLFKILKSLLLIGEQNKKKI